MNKRREKKKLKSAWLWLSLVPFGVAAFFLWQSQQTPVGGTPFKQLPVTEQEKRREHLIQLEEQVKDIQRKVQNNEKAPFKLVITEGDLNTLLQDRLNTEKFPITEPRAGFSQGQMTLEGIANYKGVSVPASLSGSLSVQNGAVLFQADSLHLKGLPAPSGWKSKAETEINKLLEKGLTKASVKLESVTIEPGQMTLHGQTE